MTRRVGVTESRRLILLSSRRSYTATVRCLVWFVMVVLSAAPVHAQTVAAEGILAGTVTDETGGILPGATVELSVAGQPNTVSTTDTLGMFRFPAVRPGPYELRVGFDGFKTTTVKGRVGARPVTQKVVLQIAGINESVAVGTRAAAVAATSAANQDAVTLGQELLSSLPVFDRDVIAMASRFLDASATGTGGVTVVVNGMEVSSLTLPASALQQIKINQDPYSAEFSRPGRGRIEILTKPGSQKYAAEANVTLRDGHLNARNAFATTPPRDRRHIFDGTFSGPLGKGQRTSFLLAAQEDTDDQQAAIVAVTPAGPIRDISPQPNSKALITGSIIRQVGDRTTISIRPAYQYESSLQRGVGGITLASAGANFRHHEQSVTYNQQTIVRPSLVNQFQFLVGHEREPTTSTSSAPGLVVAGAFIGGGAQADLTRTERHIQLTESLVWTHGQHLLQTGVQLPDWSLRGFEDRTNAAGTFYFADLAAYRAGQPDTFVQQQGNGTLSLLEKQVGLYVKDDWTLGAGLSLSMGLRYDWQNYLHDTNNVAPRVALSFAPDKQRRNVFRAGAGVFTDRSGPVVIADVRHSLPGGLTRYVITNPSYPDPFANAAGATQAPSVVRLAPDIRVPRSVQYSAGWDHQLAKALTATLTYTGARGYSLFRSRDINAPRPPLYAARPDPAYAVIREVESNGRQHSTSIQAGLRGRATKWFNGQAQYTWSRVQNDTSGIAAFPANDYDLSGEWGRADSDRRHRLTALARIAGLRLVDVGVGVTLNSGAPYSETLGGDVYANGRGRARPPGVGRNTLQGPGYADLDLRLSREVRLAQGHTTIALDAFNLSNRVNYTTIVGTRGSPLFGQPIGAREPRQLQASVQIAF